MKLSGVTFKMVIGKCRHCKENNKLTMRLDKKLLD